MTETKHSEARRKGEGFFPRYIRGDGIDIGCGTYKLTDATIGYDSLVGMKQKKKPDAVDVVGDAVDMSVFPDSRFDYVYSSHCLEHVDDPGGALQEWWRILKPGGYLIVAVPHRDYYERKLRLPSLGNAAGHKRFFLPFVADLPDTLSLYPLVASLPDSAIVRLNDFPNELTIEVVAQKGVYTPQMSHLCPWRGEEGEV